MKKNICLVVLSLFLCSCSTSNYTAPEENSTDISTDMEVTLTDQSSVETLEDLLTESYSITQLYAYFGPYCTTAENDWSGAIDNKDVYEYANITKAFPHGCLRSYRMPARDYSRNYLVYKVAEGGYFYVDFGESSESNPFLSDIPEVKKRSASLLLYVPEKPALTEKDFDKLESGVSTAEDVAKMDPSAEFCHSMNWRAVSWHMLRDGSIVEVMYSRTDEYYESHLRSELYVESVEVLSSLKNEFSFLGSINPDDLPK